MNEHSDYVGMKFEEKLSENRAYYTKVNVATVYLVG